MAPKHWKTKAKPKAEAKPKTEAELEKLIKKISLKEAKKEIRLNKEQRQTTQVFNGTNIDSDYATPAITIDPYANLARGVSETWTAGMGDLSQFMQDLAIKSVSIEVSGAIYINQTVDSEFAYFARLLLVEDLQPTASLNVVPYNGSAVNSWSSNILQDDHVTSMINALAIAKDGVEGRVKVLYDHIYQLHQGEKGVQHVKFKVNLHRATMNFYPSSTFIGSTFYAENRYYKMYIIGQDYSGNSAVAQFQGIVRTTFENM